MVFDVVIPGYRVYNGQGSVVELSDGTIIGVFALNNNYQDASFFKSTNHGASWTFMCKITGYNWSLGKHPTIDKIGFVIRNTIGSQDALRFYEITSASSGDVTNFGQYVTNWVIHSARTSFCYGHDGSANIFQSYGTNDTNNAFYHYSNKSGAWVSRPTFNDDSSFEYTNSVAWLDSVNQRIFAGGDRDSSSGTYPTLWTWKYDNATGYYASQHLYDVSALGKGAVHATAMIPGTNELYAFRGADYIYFVNSEAPTNGNAKQTIPGFTNSAEMLVLTSAIGSPTGEIVIFVATQPTTSPYFCRIYKVTGKHGSWSIPTLIASVDATTMLDMGAMVGYSANKYLVVPYRSNSSPDTRIYTTFANHSPATPTPTSPSDGLISVSTTPTLYWTFNDPDASMGDYQSAYQVQMATNPAFTANLLDTSWVTSQSNNYTPPARAYMTWYWRVRTKDAAGVVSPWSVTYSFKVDRAPTASIASPTSSGYLIGQRPKIAVISSDPEGNPCELRIRISKDNFATVLADAWATHTGELGYTGWQTKGLVANGAINWYTPQVDLGYGIVYIQVQSWDGVQVGAISTYTFEIRNPAWTNPNILNTDCGFRKVWIDELRSKINAVRQARGFSQYTFTDASISSNSTQVRGAHITELRVAIKQVTDLLGVSISWTDPSITAGTTIRKGIHIKEIRNAVVSA